MNRHDQMRAHLARAIASSPIGRSTIMVVCRGEPLPRHPGVQTAATDMAASDHSAESIGHLRLLVVADIPVTRS